MTIQRYCGELSINCNGNCGIELTESDLDVEGFDELLEAIKKDGWLIKQEGQLWRHYCPDCH